MKMSKYLFTSKNTPNSTLKERHEMNLELTERLTYVSKWFLNSKFKEDVDLFFSIADMVHEEIFVKHCRHA